jgi:hypothetical protein
MMTEDVVFGALGIAAILLVWLAVVANDLWAQRSHQRSLAREIRRRRRGTR